MLLRKDLPAAKDARIYKSIERTFLGYSKLSLGMLSFAVFLGKLNIIAEYTGKIHVSVVLEYLAIGLSLLGVFMVSFGLFTFSRDIKYLEGGIEVSPKEVTDPRIYMAAERTFLAWVRTAISLIVFGFVIEKFEFFIVQLENVFHMHVGKDGSHHTLISIGVFVIIIGIATLLLGAFNFYKTIKDVDIGYYRTRVWLYKLYGAIIFFTCLVLFVYVLRLF
ncbi:YidH family protein [Thermocrinis minervae]|uniref:Uncharacterized membrane protein YidH, DUF202 family n=1 Tax=Thermocrinis minervae TaxID=381751 RepID=A0A1M6SSA2_9AQUI|nr:DUF202 domain-containing protein [Thermocrinis minervae]SHK47559.1 Uncharacterized membrane protein YidH, DUF202 family [Thermocrinis minervae]